MKRHDLEIHLRSPVVISASSATAGQHACLDHVPGSVLLGLAASRLHAQGLSEDEAWTLFHSGRVRFGDALPVSASGETAWPVPLSWHALKGESPWQDGRMVPDRLLDPALQPLPAGRQPVQLRHGHVSAAGERVNPARQRHLKTALDRDTARAAEGQLFTYEALSPGQRFRARLDGDDTIDPMLWQRLLDCLHGPARLGRSRSAEFGQVDIRTSPASRPAQSDAEGTRLTLWLVSDLALAHDGMPVLRPEPALIGLPAGSRFLIQESFLRARHYSLYNAYRRGCDPERQVICRGSVLRYELPEPLSPACLALLQQGLGLHIESGLGQVLVNPPLLAPRPLPPLPGPVAPKPLTRPDSRLLDHLDARLRLRQRDDDSNVRARQLMQTLCQQVAHHRLSPADLPAASQWGRLKELARQQDNPSTLLAALIDSETGKLRDRGAWETRLGDTTLGGWLSSQLKPLAQQPDFPAIVAALAQLGLHDPVWQRLTHTEIRA